MENVNKVELKGILGSIRITEISGIKHARFSVGTTYELDAKMAIKATNWTAVLAWQSDTLGVDLSDLRQGMNIGVVGRLHNQIYVDSKGVEHSFTEVIAQNISIIKED